MSDIGMQSNADIGTLKFRISELEQMVSELSSENTLLRTGEESLKAITSALSDYVYTVYYENALPIKTVHELACVHVTGYTPEEYSEDPDLWINMIPQEHRERVEGFIETISNGHYPGICEHKIIHKDGVYRWVRNTPVLFYNSDGTIRSYKGFVQDVTEYVEAKHALTQSQNQLLQADKMKSLGVLVAGVAHEVNNPNNLITFNSDLIARFWREIITEKLLPSGGTICGLSSDDFKIEFSKLTDGIKEGSFRIKKIVESLKGFAQSDTGNLKEMVDLNKVVESSVFILNALIKNSTQKYTVIIDENLRDVQGNFLQLEQVVINLITNACQSTSADRCEIEISTWSTTEHQGIRVKDNGRGIHDAELVKIFDPFYTTKRDSGGTGLGLSISYGIIKAHGGELQLQSEIDSGTEAQILLPQPLD